MALKDRLLRIVVGTSLVGAVIFAQTAFSAQAFFEGAEVVEFESEPYTYAPSAFKVKQAKKLGIEPEIKTEPSIRLTGYLAKPAGEGPHPAVVLMQACAGIGQSASAKRLASVWGEVWSDRLVTWGYAVLTVDSFKHPAAQGYQCDGRGAPVTPGPGRLMPTARSDTCRLVLSSIRPASP